MKTSVPDVPALRRRPVKIATVLAISAAAIALLVAGCDDGAPNPGADAAPSVAAPRIDGLAAGGGRNYATYAHTCAAVDGGLQCWGAGESGQLGNGALPPGRSRPVAVFPPGSGVTAAAAGAEHTCAVVEGRVGCWGSNVVAQIGAPRPFIALEPNWVSALPVPALLVTAGARHTCALAAGQLWCWGRNGDGQSGIPRCKNALVHCKAPPAAVTGLPEGLVFVSLGRAHSCTAIADAAWCWGANDRGQLADGTLERRSQPERVRGLPEGVSDLAAGGDHTCVLTGGAVWCWGANEYGQLGDGSTTDRSIPVRVRGLPEGVSTIAAGSRHTCAVSPAGIHCWGNNAEGQLNGTRGAEVNAGPVLARAEPARWLAAGEDHTCAAPARGEVSCWGDDDFGQLGRAEPPPDREPRSPLPAGDTARFVDRNGDGRLTVGCLGDSNTQTIARRPRNWCEMLRELMPSDGFATVNRGEGGATAVTAGSMIHAADHFAYALDNDAVDAVILAYGTNDLLVAHAQPDAVVSAYLDFRARARIAGVDFFVALTPPMRTSENPANADVEGLNEKISDAFDPAEVIDFWSDMQSEDYEDELHLGSSGQAKRARAAWKALAAAEES